MSDRSAIARQAAHASWANTVDRSARTAKARNASPSGMQFWLDRLPSTFDDATDQQRLDAAESAKRAHFAGLARLAAQSRRNRDAGSLRVQIALLITCAMAVGFALALMLTGSGASAQRSPEMAEFAAIWETGDAESQEILCDDPEWFYDVYFDADTAPSIDEWDAFTEEVC